MRYSAGVSPDRAMRRMVLFFGVLVGAVTVAVGVVGLVAPISISSQQKMVGCGSAVAPDLSAARAKDERNGAAKPVSDEDAPDKSYTRLCLMDLDDRRIWMVTAAVVGTLTLVGILVFGHATKRSPPSQLHTQSD